MAAMLARRQDGRVAVPPPERLFARVASLPAGAPLIGRLQHVAGPPNVYLVGGAVRDLLLGGEPFDLDLVVEGDAAELAAGLGGELRAYDRFGTSTVTVNGFIYDVATARRERYARPGALPDVTPATLVDDLTRRDFTVNAIAIALTGPRAGTVSSAPHALADLSARRLRVLHDRSFLDDPTRMLRMARYASRLGFAIEPHTAALVRPDALSTVSGARVGAELRLLAREPDPVAAFICLREFGLDRAIAPRFGLRDPSAARRALALLPRDGRRDRLVLSAAATDIPAGQLARRLDHLAFERVDREVIVAAATRARAVAAALAVATRPSEIAAAVDHAGPELVALAGALGPADPARVWLDRLRRVTLEISGEDLLAAGVPPGPAIGAGLRAALAAKLDGRVSGREQELAEALNGAREPQ